MTCPGCQAPRDSCFGECNRCGVWRDPVVLANPTPMTEETRAALAAFVRELRSRLRTSTT